MFAGTLAFIAGIYCLLQFSELPSLWGSCLLVPLLLLARHYQFIIYILFFTLGFYWACLFAQIRIDNQFPTEIENKEIHVTGIVTELPEQYPKHIRFKFKIIDIDKINIPKSITTKLSWYKTHPVVKPGDVWYLTVKLKRPYGFMNPGGFDYEAWVMRQNIHALGYVKDDSKNKLLKTGQGHLLQKVRYALMEKIKQFAPDTLYGLAMALSLGERSGLTRQQKDVLTRTGTNHLIAISGLHLGLVATFFYFIAYLIWSRFYCLTERLATPLFASIAAFGMAFSYALLSNLSLPTQRALIMIATVLLALLSGHQFSFLNVISISAILILFIDPLAVIAPDFWLSYTAVFFIAYIIQFRIDKTNKLLKWLRLQCCLSLALCPILILWFKQVPLYSVLANIVAIPFVGFIIVPLLLVALIFLFPLPAVSTFIYHIIDMINTINWRYLKLLSQQEFGIIPVNVSTVFTVIFALIGVLILLMPRGLPQRWLGVFWFLPLFFPMIDKPDTSEFDFTLLDVGQGLSAIIQTKEHVLLYDTGARFSKHFNIGDAVIIPFLRNRGIDKLSMLIVSHGDNDHIGGAKFVLKRIETEKILSSVPEKLPFADAKSCHKGQQWNWDGIDFEILHPNKNKFRKGNNNSCVLRVSGEGGTVLLTGDIEKAAEKKLLMQSQEKIDVDILVVPHHGSQTSSTPAFIDAVSPIYAFFSAGYQNQFGFPKQNILSRYEERGIKTRITYQTGALSARFHKDHIQIKAFRWDHYRFWHYTDNAVP